MAGKAVLGARHSVGPSVAHSEQRRAAVHHRAFAAVRPQVPARRTLVKGQPAPVKGNVSQSSAHGSIIPHLQVVRSSPAADGAPHGHADEGSEARGGPRGVREKREGNGRRGRARDAILLPTDVADADLARLLDTDVRRTQT